MLPPKPIGRICGEGNGEGLFLSCPCDLIRSQVENHLAKPCFSSFNVHMNLLVILAPLWVKWSWRFQRGSWAGFFFNSSATNGDAAPPRLVIINTQLNKAAPAQSLTPNPPTTTQVLVAQMETVNLHSERLYYFLALESFPGLEKQAMSESVCIWKTMCTHIWTQRLLSRHRVLRSMRQHCAGHLTSCEPILITPWVIEPSVPQLSRYRRRAQAL